jgi:hypothetical protein
MSDCSPDANIPGYLVCGSGCPSGYEAVDVGGQIDCAPIQGPDLTPVDSSDLDLCANLGKTLMGPGYLEMWDETQGQSDAFARATSYCTNTYRFATKSQIGQAWLPLQTFLHNNWPINTAKESRDCALNNFRGSQGNNRLLLENMGDLTYYNLVNDGCLNCSEYPKPCPITPAPIIVPSQPLDILNPIQSLCTVEESEKGLCRARGGPFQPLRPIPNPSFPAQQIFPVPHNLPTPWYDKVWDEFLEFLSDFFLTPEYLSITIGAAVPLWMATKNLNQTVQLVGMALAAPAAYFWYRQAMRWVRDQIEKWKQDHPYLVYFEYPILAGIIGEGALAAIMALEWELGLPIVLIGETGIYGTLVVFIGAAVVWFLNTDVGKSITSVGGWIFKGIDDLIG